MTRSLIAAFLMAELLYVGLLRLDAINGVRPVAEFLVILTALFGVYGLSCALIRRHAASSSHALAWVLLTGSIMRLTLLPAGLPADADVPTKLSMIRNDVGSRSVEFEPFLLFDSDIWRYLWDGHVWASGINPYAHSPAALADWVDGDELWADVRDNVNNPTVVTIYPPAAQLVFLTAHAIAPGSVVVMKVVILVFDLAAALFISGALAALGRPRSDVALYFWNPLVIKVFAGSGHFDAALVAALAALAYFTIRGARHAAAASLALGMLFKAVPIVLVPFLWIRIGWRHTLVALGATATIFAGFLFHAGGISGFRRFAEDWYFNAGFFASLRWLASHVADSPDLAARALAALAILTTLAVLWRRDDGSAERFPASGAPALGALIFLGPVVMPWYLTWLLPFAVLARQRFWLWSTAPVCLAFLVMIDETEPVWGLAVQTAALGVLFWKYRRELPRPSPKEVPFPIPSPSAIRTTQAQGGNTT